MRWLQHILGLKVLGLRMCFRLAPVEEISPLSESFYKKKKKKKKKKKIVAVSVDFFENCF